LLLTKREQLAEQHRNATVSSQRDDLTAGLAGLGSDRMWQRVRHAAVVERTDEPTGTVHPQVAGGPDARRADIGGEDTLASSQYTLPPSRRIASVNPFRESPGIPYTRLTPDAFSIATMSSATVPAITDSFHA
jgi:hypothetical protein